MKNTILLFLSVLLLFPSITIKAQEGNAMITAVDIKYGTRKHTNAFQLSMGQIKNVQSQEVLYSINDEKVFKGKESNAPGVSFVIEMDSMNGEGVVKNMETGVAVATVKDRTLYQGDKALLTAEDYNVKKLKLFFREAGKKGKVRGSYMGKQLSAKETVLVMLVLAQDMLGLNL